MKTPKVAVFDCDGTLIDSERLSLKAWPLAGDSLGYNIDERIFFRVLGTNFNNMKKVFEEEFGSNIDMESIMTEKDKAMAEVIKNEGLNVKKGCFELIQYLKAIGIKIAVATSSPRPRAEKFLKMVKLYNEIDYIVCGNEVSNSKPHPEIFLKAAEYFNVHPSECIAFEDSKFGIEAVKRAGMISVLIPDMLEPDEEMISGVDYVLNSLDEAINIIN